MALSDTIASCILTSQMYFVELTQNCPIFVGYTINIAITFGTLTIQHVKSKFTIASLTSVFRNTIALYINTSYIGIHSICSVTIASNTFGFTLVIIILTLITSSSSVSRTTITLSFSITINAGIFSIVCITITT